MDMSKIKEVKRVVFLKEEFQALQGDLIKIARSFRDGRTCGLQELESVIMQVTKKGTGGKKYNQVVYD